MSNDIAPETKGASDLGFAFDDLMRAFEAFKETNDQRLDEIERRACRRYADQREARPHQPRARRATSASSTSWR